jgi:DNA-binding response OmpR family regulator
MTGGDMQRRRVLVVEDDILVSELVEDCLEEGGFDVQCVGRGSDARKVVETAPPDVVILDLGLPDGDGIALTTQLKSLVPHMGIIILSGRSAPVERIVGLEVGADDYLCKPFEPRELVARVRSLIRRIDALKGMAEASVANVAAPNPAIRRENTELYKFEGYTLDLERVSLTDPDEQTLHLSSTEFALLRAFVERPNRVLTRDQLMDIIHNNDMPAFDRSIDVQVARLRKKIEPDSKEPRFIKTIRNQGYIFTAPVSQC